MQSSLRTSWATAKTMSRNLGQGCNCAAVRKAPTPRGAVVRMLATIADQQPSPADSAYTSSTSSTPSASTSHSSVSSAPRTASKPTPGATITRQDLEKTARRVPSIVPEDPDSISKAQRIYLPNFIIRLVRNGPREKHNPFVATFRVPVQLTKPDIVSYLLQVYGLRGTSINTVVEMGEMVKRTPGTYKSSYRKKATKKAIVGLEEPFWFPEPRSKQWLEDHFQVDERKKALAKRLLPIGDGAKGRGRRSWRWRGTSVTTQGLGARYSNILKRIQERRAQQEHIVKTLANKEKRALSSKQLQASASKGPSASA